MNETISPKYRVAQGSGAIVSDMGGEKVMLSIHNGKYYNLGTTGGIIWDYIQQPITVEELIQKIMDEYEVEKSVCEAEVSSFLEQLSKEGLISVSQN